MKNLNNKTWKYSTVLLLAACTLNSQANLEIFTPERRADNLVILDETAVINLRLKTEMIEARDFEETVFAVGRVEEIPSKRYSVSSRIAGRAIAVNAFAGDKVTKGQVLVEVESRQPGNPPPTIQLKAIEDGLVVQTHVLTGQPVDPDTDLLDISDRSTMWAIAKIPEQYASKVQIGTIARIFIPALGGEAMEASLFRYGVTADRDSGTVEGVFEIPNKDGRLLPGMRVEFSVVLSKRSEVMAAPKEALQGDPANRVMYVKDFELPNAFVKSPVVIGAKNDRFVEVISGLFPGDEVVTRGSYSLGFVGNNSGISLKEALDAAHGHEHNEDGSEISSEQQAAEEGHDHAEGGGSSNRLLLFYAIAMTIFVVVLLQKRKSSEDA